MANFKSSRATLSLVSLASVAMTSMTSVNDPFDVDFLPSPKTRKRVPTFPPGYDSTKEPEKFYKEPPRLTKRQFRRLKGKGKTNG